MATNKKIPQRKCVGCNEMKDKNSLIRVLKTEEQGIIIDLSGKKNGRGAYICANTECLNKAIKNKGLERSFKMAIENSVYDCLKKELENIGK